MRDDPVGFRVLNEIGIIDQLARNRLERVLPHGLTVAQFTVLNHFVRLGGARAPSALARAFQVTKGTMTSTLQRLEEKGFVRLAADPADGRGKRVTLTESGARAREAAIAAAAPLVTELEQAIGRRNLATALPLLQRLRQYLDQARASEE
jgi:DNA-binding MarR family transcriptional regulator